ncbi:MAG TPA: alanine racemase [Candidatus Limnocylindria bacterium]
MHTLPAGLDTPCLVIDLDVVERNILRLQAALDERSIGLRPHVKTHKLVPIARLQLEAGAAGLTAGTLGEAEVLADAGLGDVFVAYPVWAGGPKASRLRRLHGRIRLSVGVDSVESARELGTAVRGTDRPLRVLVELDAGLGRTGVAGPTEAVSVATVARDAGLEVGGVFTHGGHAYREPAARSAAADDEVAVLTSAAEALRAAGFAIDTVSAGSTPTRLLAARPGVTEIRAGTYALNDRQQLVLGSATAEELAAMVAATVVSHPAPGRFVIDAGAKSLTKDRAEYLDGFGLLPDHPGATVSRAFDYHGIVELDTDAPMPGIGEVVAVVPNHICPVVDLYDEAVLVRGGAVVDRWPIDARGRSG